MFNDTYTTYATLVGVEELQPLLPVTYHKETAAKGLSSITYKEKSFTVYEFLRKLMRYPECCWG